jgi:hypothetical protein
MIKALATAAAGAALVLGTAGTAAAGPADLDCSDFSHPVVISQGYDPAHLDADGDGIGCEGLPGPATTTDLYADLRDPSATPTLAATGFNDAVRRHPLRMMGAGIVLVAAGGVLVFVTRRKEH